MKKVIVCLAVIYSLLLMTACPSARTIAKAKESSAKLAAYANSGIEVTRSLYQQQLITLGQKDKIAEGFLVLAKAGQAFDAAVANAETQYGTAVPKSEIEKLFAVFSSDVIAKFAAVVAELKLTGQTSLYEQAIDLLKTAILIIAKAFNKTSAATEQLAAAGVS